MHGSPQAPDQVGSRKAPTRAGLELGDIDPFEFNEAAQRGVRRDRAQMAARTRLAGTNWSYR
jgi:hypothetical protein